MMKLQAQKIHKLHPLLCIPKETIDSKDFQFDRSMNARIKLARDELQAKKISKTKKDFFHNLSPFCIGTVEQAKPCGFVTGSAGSQFTKFVKTGSSKKRLSYTPDSGIKTDSPRDLASPLSEEEVDRLCLILARDRDSILDEARNKRALRKFKKQLS